MYIYMYIYIYIHMNMLKEINTVPFNNLFKEIFFF